MKLIKAASLLLLPLFCVAQGFSAQVQHVFSNTYEITWEDEHQPEREYRVIGAPKGTLEDWRVVATTQSPHILLDNSINSCIIETYYAGELIKQSEIIELPQAKKPTPIANKAFPGAKGLKPQKKIQVLHKSEPHSYTIPSHISPSIWALVEPHFLPEKHPLKDQVDQLFQRGRLIVNKESLEEAGFTNIRVRGIDNIFALRHVDVKGVMIKTYLDIQPRVDDWTPWLRRISGANHIRACIKNLGYEDLFVVPHKWIYPLPANFAPPPLPDFVRKNFVLITQEIPILDRAANDKAYKTQVTKKILDALYNVLTQAGLNDSIYIHNIPFTKDGKIAIIDTEHFGKPQVMYEKLTYKFSPAMQEYWEKLIANGGPKK